MSLSTVPDRPVPVRSVPVVADGQLFSPESLDDPYALLANLRAGGPLCYLPGQDLYLVVGHDAVREALSRPDVFSSNIVGVLQRGEAGVGFAANIRDGSDVLATADAPTHTAHRRLVQSRFSRRSVAELTAVIDALVVPRVAELVRAGGGDWMAAVAAHVPVRVIGAIIGLPDVDADRLAHWSDVAVELLGGTATPDRMAVIVAGVTEFVAYLSSHLAAAIAGDQERTDTVLDTVADAVRLGTLTSEQGILFLVQLVTAGAESTTSLIGNALRLLATDSNLQARVRADPELVSALIEEAVRLESPFRGHFRVLGEDAELAGHRLAAGSRLMLLWGSANRDDAVFDHPDQLDLHRPNAKVHNSFGHGIHFCLGAHLARLEAQRSVVALLAATSSFTTSEPVNYVPSLFIRRLATLHVDV